MSPAPSARLLLFGGAHLQGVDGPITGRSAQRRRLALLALLAVSPRGLSRDKLIGYLWEEADTDRARRLLSEAVYVLRKALGEDAVLAAGDDLRLNDAVVWCDVAAFDAALRARDPAAAVELYGGPFLDGFFVGDAGEFEQWVEGERDRLAREYAAALRRLAEQADAAGQPEAAAGWWRLLVRQDPYAAGPALSLMASLDAAGDRAAALQHATAHAMRLARELDAEPDPQVEAFARALREAPATVIPPPVPARRVVEPASEVAAQAVPGSLPVVEATPAAAAPEPADLPVSRARARHLARPAVVLALVALAAVPAVGMLLRRGVPHPPTPATSQELRGSTVAVLPFNAQGRESQLGAAIAVLLCSALDAAGDVRTVDMNALASAVRATGSAGSADLAVPLANRFGATRFILGDVLESPATVTVTATLYDIASPDQAIGHVAETASRDSLPLVVEHLATQLLTLLKGEPGDLLLRMAGGTAGSFAALKAFAQGNDEFQAGRYDRAVGHFRQAVSADSSFSLAHYRLSVAAEWSFEFLLARSAARKALETSKGLTGKETLLLLAWRAFLEGRYEEAERQYAQILGTDPGNVEALSGHAEVLAHFNPVRGEPAADAEAGFARVLELAPDYGEARFHALEFAARSRNRTRYDSLFSQIDPRSAQLPAWRAVRAYAFGTPAEQDRAVAALEGADELTIAIAAARVAANAAAFQGARRIARLLTAPHHPKDLRAGAHLLSAQLHLASGDWPAAQRELELASPLERNWTTELYSLYLLHPSVSATANELAAARTRLLEWNPGASTPSLSFFFGPHAEIHALLRWYLLGLISVRQGDAEAARNYRVELLRTGRRGPQPLLALALAQSLEGHIARRSGATAEAIRLLETATIEAAPEFIALSPFYARAHDRFTIAELYQAAGDTAAAARWYSSLLDGFDYVYATAAHDRLASLLQRSDPAAAAAHRLEFQRLTSHGSR